MKQSAWLISILVIIIAIALNHTGFLQENIDARDLAHYTYKEGVMEGAESYALLANNESCWVMLHGYTSSPAELREVAEAVHQHCNATVHVPRLLGHGEVPSNLEKYTILDDYKFMKAIIEDTGCKNLLGSSRGGALAMGYASFHSMENVVVASLPMELTISSPKLAAFLEKLVRYGKNKKMLKREKQIGYLHMPLKGVKELLIWNELLIEDIHQVNADVLFLHAQEDTAAKIGGAKKAYERITSTKSFVALEGGHVVFMDKDREKAIKEVIKTCS